MRRTHVALIFGLALLLPQSVRAAPPPPNAYAIALEMGRCLPITDIHREFDDYTVRVEGYPDGFSVVDGDGGGTVNSEHYHHWWNYDVMLIFVRYPVGVEPMLGWPETRRWRNRIIQCFYAVPPVPDDF